MTSTRVEQLTSIEDLDALEPLWIALHHHHQSVSDFRGFVADDALSWQRRRAHYAQALAAGTAVVLLARDDDGPTGYALARVINEPDNTFNTRSAFAELESLSVRDDARGGWDRDAAHGPP